MEHVSDKLENKSVLELSMMAGDAIRNIIIEHMAKMHHLELQVDEYDLQTIENEDCLKDYYQRCLQEIESMKKTSFYQNLSIDVLFKCEKVISAYTRNKKVVKALEKKEYERKFPIYFTSLKKRFHAIAKKQRLRDAEDSHFLE